RSAGCRRMHGYSRVAPKRRPAGRRDCPPGAAVLPDLSSLCPFLFGYRRDRDLLLLVESRRRRVTLAVVVKYVVAPPGIRPGHCTWRLEVVRISDHRSKVVLRGAAEILCRRVVIGDGQIVPGSASLGDGIVADVGDQHRRSRLALVCAVDDHAFADAIVMKDAGDVRGHRDRTPTARRPPHMDLAGRL